MRHVELGRLLLLMITASPGRGLRRRRVFVRSGSGALATLLFGFPFLLWLRSSDAAVVECALESAGWCLARRISGDVTDGELGFRFGEPLDADGDGVADIAAGSRFKRQEGAHQNGNASVWSGATGSRIREWDGTDEDGLFGHWVLPVRDLDGDELADLVIAAPTAKVDGGIRGVLEARSPKSGVTLWRRTGSRVESFGWDLAITDDYDGDGHRDLIVGAPSSAGGRVYLINVKDATVVREFAPPISVESFGWYVAALGDLDGDGRGDLAVGAHLEKDADANRRGGVYIMSSATGAVLRHFRGPGPLSGFGEIVAAVGDLDGDGRGDLAVGAPRTNDQSRTLPGEVFVYSGASGKPLHRWQGSQPGELFGRMVVGAGDVDGDGTDDVAIGAPWYRRDGAEKTGRVEIRSGRSGEVLNELFGQGAEDWFGWHIRRAPDPTHSRRPALLIAALRRDVNGHAATGALELYVFRRGE